MVKFFYAEVSDIGADKLSTFFHVVEGDVLHGEFDMTLLNINTRQVRIIHAGQNAKPGAANAAPKIQHALAALRRARRVSPPR